MKPLLLLVGCCWCTLTGLAAKEGSAVFVGSVERLDPGLDALLAPEAKLEKLADGFSWAEGPVWLDGAMLFSDVPQNVVYRWTEGAAKAEVFLQPSGLLTPAPGFREPGSNGLSRDAEGRLLLAQHGERRIARYSGGAFTSVADRFDGKRFNSPNDLAVRKSGEIYFTDPPYGLEGTDKSPLRELPWAGVYRVTNDGEVRLVSKTLTWPNGIAFSPDEKTLYVAVSDPSATRVVAFDVSADGTVANERVFFDAQPRSAAGGKGLCDGLKVDRDGNVWSTGPGGVLVISPGGKLLGVLNTGVPTANCGWGGDDGSVLYLTANNMLLRVKTKTKGAGW